GGTPATAISTTPAHATPSFNHMSQLISKVEALNGSTSVTSGQAECDGIAVHSRFKQTVRTLGTTGGGWTDQQGRPLWVGDLNGDGSAGSGLLGVRWAPTNVLPVNLVVSGGTASSYAIAGAWREYVLFECQTFTFDATPYAQGYASDRTQ